MKTPSMMILVAAALAGGEAVAATYYELTTLDVPFGTPGTTMATGVNNAGEVVGSYAGPDGDYNGPYPHAFKWVGGTFTRITNAVAMWNLNDSGLAVGRSVTPGTSLLHDVRTGQESTYSIPGLNTTLTGINNAGQVTGTWGNSFGSGGFTGPWTDAGQAQLWNHPYVNHRNEWVAIHGIDNLGRVSGYVDAPYDITPELPYYIGGFYSADPLTPGTFINYNYGATPTHITASNTNDTRVGWYYSGGGYTTGIIMKGGVAEPFLVELPRVISTDIWTLNDLGWLAGSYVQLNDYNQPVRHGFVAVPMQPQPIPLEMQKTGNQLVFTWYSKAFTLQCATALKGVFTNIPGATSPWTNSMSGNRLFFRLMAEGE